MEYVLVPDSYRGDVLTATGDKGQGGMGWLHGKRLIIKPAAGPTKSLDAEPHHVCGRRLLVDVSGVLHKAICRGARSVAMTGTSPEAEQYVASYIDSLFQLGAKPILVFDGCRYPPKKATQDGRRAAAAASKTEAERLEQAGLTAKARKAWKMAASVQEPLTRAIMAHCTRREIEFIVSPYEADTQLIACLEAGQGDAVLVLSDDSDIVALGACDALYEYDPVKRTTLRIQPLTDILGQVVGEGFDFVGWNYDRFLVFCIMCKCDFMDNIRGWALKKVQRAMATAKLSDSLLVSVGQPHPPVAGRPAAWGTPEAIQSYIQPVLDAVCRGRHKSWRL